MVTRIKLTLMGIQIERDVHLKQADYGSVGLAVYLNDSILLKRVY